jgi:hypothetical protein
LLDAGNPPNELSTTTSENLRFSEPFPSNGLDKKLSEGPVVTPLPYGKNVESKGQSAGEHPHVP